MFLAAGEALLAIYNPGSIDPGTGYYGLFTVTSAPFRVAWMVLIALGLFCLARHTPDEGGKWHDMCGPLSLW